MGTNSAQSARGGKKKHVFGSEAKVAGKGSQTYALCAGSPFSFFVCRETKISPFYRCCFWFRSLVPNGMQIGDGRAFQHKSLFGELNFQLPQNCQAETKPRLLPMCCYGLVFVLLVYSVGQMS